MAKRTPRPADTPTPTPTPAPPDMAPIDPRSVPVDVARRIAALHTALTVVRDTRLTPDNRADVVTTADMTLRSTDPTIGDGVRSVCRVTGLNVETAQNALFAINESDAWKFADDTIAVAWAIMFPANNARVCGGAGFVADVARYIGGTRSAYNRHRHGGLPTWQPFMASTGRRGRKPESTPVAIPAAA